MTEFNSTTCVQTCSFYTYIYILFGFLVHILCCLLAHQNELFTFHLRLNFFIFSSLNYVLVHIPYWTVHQKYCYFTCCASIHFFGCWNSFDLYKKKHIICWDIYPIIKSSKDTPNFKVFSILKTIIVTPWFLVNIWCFVSYSLCFFFLFNIRRKMSSLTKRRHSSNFKVWKSGKFLTNTTSVCLGKLIEFYGLATVYEVSS